MNMGYNNYLKQNFCFRAAQADFDVSIKDELSYAHMLALSAHFLFWAEEVYGINKEQAARFVGWATSLENLANALGKNWSPSPPQKLSVLGFLARKLTDQIG